MAEIYTVLDFNEEDSDAKVRLLTEITENFGDPLEIVRELLSNASDAEAKMFTITLSTLPSGKTQMKFKDTGKGMGIYHGRLCGEDCHRTHEHEIEIDKLKFFFKLAKSDKKDRTTIGFKGFGSKISFVSDRIEIKSIYEKEDGTLHGRKAVLERPWNKIERSENLVIEIEDLEDPGDKTFTEIIVDNFNLGQLGRFNNIYHLKEYILWFTAGGSVKPYFNDEFDPIKIKIIDKRLGSELSVEFDGKHNPPLDCDPTILLPTAFSDKQTDTIGDETILYKSRLFSKRVEFDNPTDEWTASTGERLKIEVCAWILGKSQKDTFADSIFIPDRDRFGLWIAQNGLLVQRKYEWIATSPMATNYHVIVNCDQLELNADRTQIKGKKEKILSEIESRFKNKFKPSIMEVYQEFDQLNKTEKAIEDELKARLENRVKVEDIDDREDWPFSNLDLGIKFVPICEIETCMLLASIQTKYLENLGLKCIATTGKGTDCIVEIINPASGLPQKKHYEVEYALVNIKSHKHAPDNINGIIAWTIGGNKQFQIGRDAYTIKRGTLEHHMAYSPDENQILIFTGEKPTSIELREKSKPPNIRIPVVLLEQLCSEISEEVERE